MKLRTNTISGNGLGRVCPSANTPRPTNSTGAVGLSAKKFFFALAQRLKERDEAEEKCRLRKPVQIELTQYRAEHLLTKQALCFSVKSMSTGCVFPNTQWRGQRDMSVSMGTMAAPGIRAVITVMVVPHNSIVKSYLFRFIISILHAISGVP